MIDYYIPKNTVVGTLKVAKGIYSPQLDNKRNILVWLPDNYSASDDKRYPVIYMHDGQNLFDAVTSYAGEWQVDETMQALAQEGIEAIVVGIPNNAFRINEYNPYDQGEQYITFIVETVKPLIDSTFRTKPERESTGIAGSSLGGLISLYAYFYKSDVFGYVAAFSPAYWGCGDIERLTTFIQRADVPTGKIYQDVGTAEDDEYDIEYVKIVREMDAVLQAKGYQHGDNLSLVIEEAAMHNEAAWARRFPDALRFLMC